MRRFRLLSIFTVFLLTVCPAVSAQSLFPFLTGTPAPESAEDGHADHLFPVLPSPTQTETPIFSPTPTQTPTATPIPSETPVSDDSLDIPALEDEFLPTGSPEIGYTCPICHGTGICQICHGKGHLATDVTCLGCWGTTHCKYCHGTGVIIR